MTPVRLEPAALRSQVKHSTTEPLRSLCLNGPGHMTKMAATPIHGKNPLKADDLGTWYVGPTKFVQMKILG